jgi:hypothetical protein
MTATAPAAVKKASGGGLFSPVIVICLVAVGVFAFSAFIVLQTYAPDLRPESNGGNHALSRSAVGYAGLVELLKDRGDQVIISRGPILAPKTAPGLLILTPGPETDPADVAKVKFSGLTLIVLPKWIAPPNPFKREWVVKVGLLEPPYVAEHLPKEDFPKPLTVSRRTGVTSATLTGTGDEWPFRESTTHLATGPIESLQTLSGEGITPVLTDDKGGVLLAQGARTDVFILSDPDLLDTQGIKNLVTARAGLAVVDELRHTGGPVIMDVTLHGYSRGRNIMKLAFEPPFLALTLCLVAAALMAGWHAFARFGPTPAHVRAFAFGKRGLVDNSSALIKVAGREPRMAPGYVAVERNTVAWLVGAPKDLDRAQLDAFLDRLGAAKNTTDTIAGLAAEADRVKNIADLMRVATRLHRWRMEMTRERQ